MTEPSTSGRATPEVLFVCVHNAGRSQMAAALLAHHAGDRVVVRSAGTAPADEINPAVVAVMAEVGIDLRMSGARPKRLDDAAVRASDVVITMGAVTSARCTRASATSTGRCPTRPDRASTPCDRSATRSTGGSERSCRSFSAQQHALGRAPTLTGSDSAAGAQHSPSAGCMTGASASTV